LTLADLLQEIRAQVVDSKVVEIQAVDESAANSKFNPHDSGFAWFSFATGKNYEEFLTQHTPLVSGCEINLRGGRWDYTSSGNWGRTGNTFSNQRVFFIDYNNGMFVLPSGATPIASGETVKLTYSWYENQEYEFTDTDIKSWVLDGDMFLRNKLTPPYVLSGRGETLNLAPMPSGFWFSLLALSTSYAIRRRKNESALDSALVLREGTTYLDLTRSLAHRGKSLEQVKEDLDAVVHMVQLGELSGAGVKLNLYNSRERDGETTYHEAYRTDLKGFSE
jgi:hypothetical protein